MSIIDLNSKTSVIHDIPIQASVNQLKEILWHEKQLEVYSTRMMYAGKLFEDGKGKSWPYFGFNS